MITYTEEKKFDNKSVVDLFSSVGWVSAQYPTRLYKALMHSSTVITAWDGDRLVGLVRVLDDSELVAYMHYVLVHPDYQVFKSWKMVLQCNYVTFQIRFNLEGIYQQR